jgi:hypothetical protein
LPAGTHDGNSLTNLRRDECHLFFWYPANGDLDMRILQALDDARDCARISVGNHLKAELRNILA